MKKYALGELVEQIKYSTNNELVSSDIVGTSAPIYDSNATIVSNGGKNIVLYIWYDNEYGYSHQVIDWLNIK
jgi:glyceraldehyde 3-phosphate dehydrogenase